MPSTTQPISSLLAFDVNPDTISACLIERQEGVYRIAGMGKAPISIGMQGLIDRKCILKTLNDLVKTSGYELLGDNGDLLTPADGPDRGVDRVCLSWSLPVPIKVIVVGLMPAWSLAKGKLLADEMRLDIVEQISIADGRSEEERMDVILSKRPDLIILTGGVEGGANYVVRSFADMVARSISVLPQEIRPVTIFAGNSLVAEYVKSKLEPLTLIFAAPNLQTSLSEIDLQPAREVLSDVCNRLWLKRFGLQAGTRPMVISQARPSIRATEDMIAILGICEGLTRGGIAIQLNGLASSLSVSKDGQSISYQQINTCVQNDPGWLIDQYKLKDVNTWSVETIDSEHLEGYLAAEILYPHRIPVNSMDAAIDQSISRLAGRRTWEVLREKQGFPAQMHLRNFGAEADIILIGGSRLQQMRHPGQSLLQMLDILQPVGISEVFIDQDGIVPSLGSAALLDARIPLHCILGQAIPRLATLIAPIHHVRDGSRVMSIVLEGDDGHETNHEIKAGEITSIPLGMGEKARIKIILHRGVRMGTGYDIKSKVTLNGGILGIVIDGRGRPLTPRKDSDGQQIWLKQHADQVLGLGG